MFRRQLCERILDALSHFAALRFLERIAELARQPLDLGFGFLAAHRRMAALAAAKIDRDVGGNSVQPGREARARFEFADVFKSTYETLLSQLQRIFLIMNHCHRDSDDSPLITLDQDAKRLGVPPFGPLDELGFVPILADRLVQWVRRGSIGQNSGPLASTALQLGPVGTPFELNLERNAQLRHPFHLAPRGLRHRLPLRMRQFEKQPLTHPQAPPRRPPSPPYPPLPAA